MEPIATIPRQLEDLIALSTKPATPDAYYGQERETSQPATLQPPSRLTGPI
jgi:hypothetical protein